MSQQTLPFPRGMDDRDGNIALPLRRGYYGFQLAQLIKSLMVV